ncbi:MAG: DinB family protein [Bryobacteraceae bacterium]
MARLEARREAVMAADSELRKQLVELLRGGHAHATFEQTVKDFPLDEIAVRPAGMPHSAWELLEHLRITQNDILLFSTQADYVSPDWPKGYWPSSPGPSQTTQWENSVKLFRSDLAAMERLVLDEKQDLHKPFPWGDGQTLLREALLVADHTSYHLGQLLLVRRALGAWPG